MLIGGWLDGGLKTYVSIVIQPPTILIICIVFICIVYVKLVLLNT